MNPRRRRRSSSWIHASAQLNRTTSLTEILDVVLGVDHVENKTNVDVNIEQ